MGTALRFDNVRLAAIGYELPSDVVTSAALEARLAPAYARLRIPGGQLAGMTGIRERRWWPADASLSVHAAQAGRKALAAGEIPRDALGALIYAGVCREQLEPATACAVAHQLGVPGDAQIYDVSNACLGVLNGMVQVATAISAGFMKAGLIVSTESARQIVELMMGRLLAEPTMDRFKTTLATLTGGSGAIGVLLAHESLAPNGPRLRGAVIRGAPQHHGLCRWGPDTGMPSSAPMTMETHAIELMNHGVKLGVETWRDFAPLVAALPRAEGPAARVGGPPIDASICHQVGAANRDSILAALGLPAERDYTTYETLGNIGTVSLPITAALAAERGLLRRGDRVGWLGIGSGLNCLMLCVDW